MKGLAILLIIVPETDSLGVPEVLAAAILQRGRLIDLDGPSVSTRHLDFDEVFPVLRSVPEVPNPTSPHDDVICESKSVSSSRIGTRPPSTITARDPSAGL